MRTFSHAGRVLGDLEQRVMDLLWRQTSPVSVRDAMRRLGGKLAYTTVMTTLDRLYKKGLLARQKEGNAFVYWPAMTRDDVHRRIVEETVSGLLKKSSAPVLTAFVDAAVKVDADNLARLEQILARHRRGK
jgi:predicted transcriptional regulator